MEVRRDEGRRRLRVLLAAAVTVGTASGVFGLTRSPLLDVDRVDVKGAQNTPVAEVVAASGLSGGPPLVDLDLAVIERSVEALPWIAEATATRRFPNRVEVQVRERVPLAAVVTPVDGVAMVDETGRVLSHTDSAPDGLIRIEQTITHAAPGTSVAGSTRGALDLVDLLPPLLADRVAAVRVDAGGRIDLRLDDRITVLVGEPVELETKLVALATLVERVDLRTARSIDVRVPSAPVVARAG